MRQLASDVNLSEEEELRRLEGGRPGRSAGAALKPLRAAHAPRPPPAAKAMRSLTGGALPSPTTPSENVRSYDTNADRKSSAPKRSKPVLGRRHGSEEEWVEYESGNAAARELGVDPGCVSACCREKQKRTGEYEFKLAPPAEDQHDKPGEEWRDVQLVVRVQRISEEQRDGARTSKALQ